MMDSEEQEQEQTEDRGPACPLSPLQLQAGRHAAAAAAAAAAEALHSGTPAQHHQLHHGGGSSHPNSAPCSPTARGCDGAAPVTQLEYLPPHGQQLYSPPHVPLHAQQQLPSPNEHHAYHPLSHSHLQQQQQQQASPSELHTQSAHHDVHIHIHPLLPTYPGVDTSSSPLLHHPPAQATHHHSHHAAASPIASPTKHSPAVHAPPPPPNLTHPRHEDHHQQQEEQHPLSHGSEHAAPNTGSPVVGPPIPLSPTHHPAPHPKHHLSPRTIDFLPLISSASLHPPIHEQPGDADHSVGSGEDSPSQLSASSQRQSAGGGGRGPRKQWQLSENHVGSNHRATLRHSLSALSPTVSCGDGGRRVFVWLCVCVCVCVLNCCSQVNATLPLLWSVIPNRLSPTLFKPPAL